MRRPYDWSYDGATNVALGDGSGRWERTLFDHSFVSLEGFWEFVSSGFGDWFMLGTHTFHEGGVMIHCFGPLGCLGMQVCHAILGGVGVVTFRVQFCEECCYGNVHYSFVVTLMVYI